MRRHTLMALCLAAGLALPIGFSTPASAVTDEQRQMLGNAASGNPATMQAAIATVLQASAQDRPLDVALDELATTLLDLGVTDEFKAEFAVALVIAAQDLAAAGDLPGVTADAAGEAAALSVLSKAQGSPALVSAMVANASARAAGDTPGDQGTAALGAFVAASASPSIDSASRNQVQQALLGGETPDSVGESQNFASRSTTFYNAGTGIGPNLGNMALVGASAGSGAGRGGGIVDQQTGGGETISPN